MYTREESDAAYAYRREIRAQIYISVVLQPFSKLENIKCSKSDDKKRIYICVSLMYATFTDCSPNLLF